MADDPQNQKPPKLKSHFFLRLDAWIDSTLWNAGFRFVDVWEDITIFFRKFRVKGWKRIPFELAGEALTWGSVGLVLMLALAKPTFELIKEDWRKRQDFSVTFLDRYGSYIGSRGANHADSIPIDEMPDYLIKAVLATEDRRFFDHFGIDIFGLVRAITTNAQAGGVVQGGSTLTQQLAKNLFLSNERSFDRKIKEAFLALWLETHYTKKEILSLYLDRAYMGGGAFGVAAAARFYFGKEIPDLTLAESAMLAGLFKAPTKYAPHINLPAARARANEVLTNLVQGGLMTEGEVIDARRHPATAIDRSTREAPDFFLDWAYDETLKLAKNFPTHSLVVRTTIDMNLQKAAEDSVETGLRQYGEAYHVKQGALVMIENGGDNGGAVRAMVGGRDYGETQFNRATKALRQPGSSFKVYTYSLAMEKGFTPSSIVVDGPVSWRGWSPQNYGRSYAGSITILTAIAKSINSIPVKLAKDYIGTEAISRIAKEMGVETPIRTDKTIPLGTSELTVMDQATAYAVFPAEGMQSRRHGITQITDYDGKVLYDFNRDAPPARRVLSKKAADYMNQMLSQIPYIGTARKAALDNGIVTAGKTGTTQAYRDAWFCGFTGNYTAAIWFGNDDYTSTNNMTGGSLPAMTFKLLMDYAHQGIELRPIPGIENPLPSIDPKTAAAEAKRREEEAKQNNEPAFVRPRMLTAASTRLLREIGEKLKAAPPLKLQEKVAEAG